MGYEKTKIVKFFKDNFDQVILEEKILWRIVLIEEKFFTSLVLMGKERTIPSLRPFCMLLCKGTYINWFAVTQKTYDSSRFGKHANGTILQYGLRSSLLKWFSYKQSQATNDVTFQANMAA